MVGCVESHHRAGGSHLDLTQALSAVEKGGQIKEGKRQGKNASTKKVQKSGGKNCCENCYASCMLARRAFCWRALIISCLGCHGGQLFFMAGPAAAGTAAAAAAGRATTTFAAQAQDARPKQRQK